MIDMNAVEVMIARLANSELPQDEFSLIVGLRLENIRLRDGLIAHGERILMALDNCMHEYGEEPAGEAAMKWVSTALDPEP